MIECSSCGRGHRPGTLFCNFCGIYLATGGPLRTQSLPEGQFPASRANPWAMGSGEDGRNGLPTSLCITIPSSGRQVHLPVAPEIRFGRLDAAHGVFPDLDLTADDGRESGISRRHAKITQVDSRLYVEDVGSFNGTFLNGQRLTPFLSYRIKDGDELQIGKLKLDLEFV